MKGGGGKRGGGGVGSATEGRFRQERYLPRARFLIAEMSQGVMPTRPNWLLHPALLMLQERTAAVIVLPSAARLRRFDLHGLVSDVYAYCCRPHLRSHSASGIRKNIVHLCPASSAVVARLMHASTRVRSMFAQSAFGSSSPCL